MTTAETIQARIEKQIAIAMCGRNVRGRTLSDSCEVDVLNTYDPKTDKFTEVYRIATPQFDRRIINFNIGDKQ